MMRENCASGDRYSLLFEMNRCITVHLPYQNIECCSMFCRGLFFIVVLIGDQSFSKGTAVTN